MSERDSIPESTPLRRIGTVAVTVTLVTSLFLTAVGPASAQTATDRPAVIVDLETDGSADLTIVFTYDLTTDTERQAFETLQTDDEAIATLETRFESRMDAVVAAIAERTDRAVTVAGTTVTTDVVDGGETGVVRLAATIEGFAAVEGDRLIVTEPFASGFESDRVLVVRPPDGYVVANATPSPTNETGDVVTWDPETSLEDFELVVESDDGATATSTPGFGVPLAIGAVVGSALLFRRRT